MNEPVDDSRSHLQEGFQSLLTILKEMDDDVPCDILQTAIESLLTIVVSIAKVQPQSLNVTDPFDQTAVNIACHHSKEISFIKELIKLNPEAVDSRDNRSMMTPLKRAFLRSDLPLDIYETLLDAIPRHKALGLKTVLHDACECGASLQVLRMLLLATRYPDSICFKNKTDHYEDTPLQAAIRFGKVSTEGIGLLIRACPENLSKTNNEGETPLNLALSVQAPRENIQLLLDRGPEAAGIKNNDGDYPLHQLGGGRPTLLRQIYNLYPEAIHKVNENGFTPLHCASSARTVKDMEFLVERSVGSIVLNADDRTPYDLALSSNREEAETQLVLDYMDNATKNAACAMIECILHPKSNAPIAVLQHVRDTAIALLPANATINSMDAQHLVLLLRPHMDHDMLYDLLLPHDLQNLLKEEDHHFPSWICGMVKMNKTNRYYFKEDPFDNLGGVRVLDSVADISVECMFLHLKENPLLCDRKLSTGRACHGKETSSRKRKTRSDS
jgi:ankyrin repeat protein